MFPFQLRMPPLTGMTLWWWRLWTSVHIVCHVSIPVAYASIDWHDFVVVETVYFSSYCLSCFHSSCLCLHWLAWLCGGGDCGLQFILSVMFLFQLPMPPLTGMTLWWWRLWTSVHIVCHVSIPVAYASIDWHDFVVVETVDFSSYCLSCFYSSCLCLHWLAWLCGGGDCGLQFILSVMFLFQLPMPPLTGMTLWWWRLWTSVPRSRETSLRPRHQRKWVLDCWHRNDTSVVG